MPSCSRSLELVGEVLDPVGQAMGQAGLAEPAVATARPERDRLRLEDHDRQRRVRVGQGDGRPQPREPGADDGHVGGQALAGRPAAGRRTAASPRSQ